MAFPAVYVVCAVAGTADPRVGQGGLPLPGPGIWSESVAVGATTTRSAPASTDKPLIFRVKASADVYVVIDDAPDTVNGCRWPVAAGTTEDFLATVNDKLAVVAA